MRLICVDDEKLLLEDNVAVCEELPEVEKAFGFNRAMDALNWLDENEADIALLDIDMPDMSGLTLAQKIKEKHPDMPIIFLTGYAQYAVEAFQLHASGYLLKPLDVENLRKEINYALGQSSHQNHAHDHINVKTFGSFDVFVDGEPMKFKMAKCKELLAYLVDRQGGSVTRAESFAVLWEDRDYDRKMQKQFDVYIRSLRETMQEYNVTEMFEMSRGSMRVVPDTFSCDAYRFYEGDVDAVNSFRGEYMSSYPWARMTESRLFWEQKN